MADEHSQRQYRTNEYPRAAGAGSASDPLVELARLIGQTDPFAEFGQKQKDQTAATPHRHGQQEWAPQPYAAQPYAQQAAAESFDASAQAGYGQDAQSYDSDPYYQNDPYSEGEQDYDDAPPPRRRFGIIAATAVLGLAVIGTAGAFGYKALFGSSGSTPPPIIKADVSPTKVVPPSKSEPQSNKLIYDRVGDRSSGEKLVSREEQPIDIKQPMQASLFPNAAGARQAAATPLGAAGIAALDQPKKIHTIVIRPDQPQGTPESPPARTAAAVPAPPPAPTPAPARTSAPQRLASAPPITTADAEDAPVARPAPARPAAPQRNAPLSLSPNAQPAAPAEPVRTASAPATRNPAPVASASGQYAVQISSQRSEEEAQAAFRALQAKYPAQLNGRQPIIRRADLGSKGIYYRAMVGPFATSGEASELCQSLKAAGGSCLIQKN